MSYTSTDTVNQPCLERCERSSTSRSVRVTDIKKCINENKNPQKIRKYTQLTLKSIFSKNQLKEYLKNVEEKCISKDEMKKNKEIRKFLYLRTYFEYNSKKYIN